MNKEEQILINRFSDLQKQAFYKNMPVTTDFLSLYEQTIFAMFIAKNPEVFYVTDGGYELAERKIVCFLPVWANKEDYNPKSFLKCARIDFTAPKYADSCTHRDYLGSIMNLGMERAKFGDILVSEQSAYVIGLMHSIDYIKEQLTMVKHSNVTVCEVDFEEMKQTLKFDEITGTVSSLRLDSVVGLAFRISRGKAVDAIRAEKIFVNGREMTQPDYKIKPGDILSFRGVGKAVFKEYLSHTKKDREAIKIWRYK
jgi:RNA-binding protein YlmH